MQGISGHAAGTWDNLQGVVKLRKSPQPPMFDAGELLLKALIAITSITVSLMDSNGVLTDKKKETHCSRIFKTSFAIVTSNFSAF